MKAAKTAEQRAVEDAEWLAKKVGFMKGLKNPTEMQKLFVLIAETDATKRTAKQAKQLAVFIKIERLAERAAEARAEGMRLLTDKPVKNSRKADDDRRKILMGAMLMDQMKKEPAVKPGVVKMLNEFLTRPADRALFDFLPAEQNSLSA